jgi:phosphoribosylformimino-5-aminoimidazole carboxamide ribotide isomerase
MEIIPAIDIKDGNCVRLYQGDYSKQTIFDTKPAAVALRWKTQGARWLHIVDLDGAATGEMGNLIAIEEIIRTSGLLVQIGGGIRREEVAEELMRKGVNRIVLGTAAVEKPELVKKLCRRFGEAIIVGLDTRDGMVYCHGWQKDTVIGVLQLGQLMVKLGVKRFIYTDIKRDGTLTEPNFETVGKLIAEMPVPIIASGGISRLEHLQRLEELGVEGAIIGKALYTGDINLREAINSIRGKRTDA